MEEPLERDWAISKYRKRDIFFKLYNYYFQRAKKRNYFSEAKQGSKNIAAREQEESLGIQPAAFRMTSHKRLGGQLWQILLKCPQGQAADNSIHMHTKGTGGRLAQ